MTKALKLSFLFMLLISSTTQAAELGHYSAAAPGTRDFLVPPAPGAYYAQYNLYYTTDTYKDHNGNKVNTVSAGGGTVDVDVNLDTVMIMPAFMYVTDKKILGARYAFYAIQPFGDMGLDAQITSNLNRGLNTSNSSFGLNDTYIQPLWLSWETDHSETMIGYGLYLPTGKYKANDIDNIGLGYLTHQFQAGGAHYFDDHKMTAVTGALTYEINHNKQGVDIQPGNRLSLNVGFDHTHPINKEWLGTMGVYGFGQWQMTRDHGSDATRTNVKDQIYGIGIVGGITYMPLELQVNLRWAHEMQAEDRFEGENVLLVLARHF